jgi:hypothetical protein
MVNLRALHVAPSFLNETHNPYDMVDNSKSCPQWFFGFLIFFEALTNILFVVQVTILHNIKWSHKLVEFEKHPVHDELFRQSVGHFWASLRNILNITYDGTKKWKKLRSNMIVIESVGSWPVSFTLAPICPCSFEFQLSPMWNSQWSLLFSHYKSETWTGTLNNLLIKQFHVQ